MTVARRRRPGSSAASTGSRKPRIALIAPGASPQEAAAVVAALERFISDTAPPPAVPAPGPSRWLRAALLEGISRAEHRRRAWGDPRP